MRYKHQQYLEMVPVHSARCPAQLFPPLRWNPPGIRGPCQRGRCPDPGGSAGGKGMSEARRAGETDTQSQGQDIRVNSRVRGAFRKQGKKGLRQPRGQRGTCTESHRDHKPCLPSLRTPRKGSNWTMSYIRPYRVPIKPLRKRYQSHIKCGNISCANDSKLDGKRTRHCAHPVGCFYELISSCSP